MTTKLKAVVETKEVLNGLKVSNTIINNSLVSVDNKYLNVLNIKNNIYFMAIGNSRMSVYMIGKLKEEPNRNFMYHLKYNQLAQALSTLGSEVGESLEFTFEFEDSDDGDLEESRVVVRSNRIKLSLISYSTDDTSAEMDSLLAFEQGEDRYDRTEYLNVLSTMSAMLQNQDSSIIVTNTGYAYTQEDGLVISRLKYDFDHDHVLDLQSVKTILEELKDTHDDYVYVNIDVENERYSLRAGNSIYVLNGMTNYYPDAIVQAFNNFETENTLTMNYKEFIRGLKLTSIYLEDDDDAVLEYDGGLMTIIPSTAYQEDGLNRSDSSYSDVKIEATCTTEDLTLSIPLDKVLRTLGVVKPEVDEEAIKGMNHVKDLVFNVSDDDTNAGLFKHETGDVLLGVRILDQE